MSIVAVSASTSRASHDVICPMHMRQTILSFRSKFRLFDAKLVDGCRTAS